MSNSNIKAFVLFAFLLIFLVMAILAKEVIDSKTYAALGIISGAILLNYYQTKINL